MSLVRQKINGDHNVIYVKTVIHQYLQLVDLYLDTKGGLERVSTPNPNFFVHLNQRAKDEH